MALKSNFATMYTTLINSCINLDEVRFVCNHKSLICGIIDEQFWNSQCFLMHFGTQCGVFKWITCIFVTLPSVVVVVVCYLTMVMYYNYGQRWSLSINGWIWFGHVMTTIPRDKCGLNFLAFVVLQLRKNPGKTLNQETDLTGDWTWARCARHNTLFITRRYCLSFYEACMFLIVLLLLPVTSIL